MDHHDGITRIETFGVEQIPDHERHATPFDLFRLIFGGANTFATAALDRAPILFGRSFTAGGLAIARGVLGGATQVYLALLRLFSEPAAVYGSAGARCPWHAAAGSALDSARVA